MGVDSAGDFAETAKRDSRFQAPGSGLIALADEPDPWDVLLERIEQEQARMMARHRWND
ncbi:MAG: hypothetical protein ISS49_04795 [Anaerolineae bacterium]|nr:hypothetical protein [Anaerolineae bacterium]